MLSGGFGGNNSIRPDNKKEALYIFAAVSENAKPQGWK
jgi:hypothetical protein